MVFDREIAHDDDPAERLQHYREFSHSLPPEKIKEQAYRCMNCDPFCHSGRRWATRSRTSTSS